MKKTERATYTVSGHYLSDLFNGDDSSINENDKNKMNEFLDQFEFCSAIEIMNKFNIK